MTLWSCWNKPTNSSFYLASISRMSSPVQSWLANSGLIFGHISGHLACTYVRAKLALSRHPVQTTRIAKKRNILQLFLMVAWDYWLLFSYLLFLIISIVGGGNTHCQDKIRNIQPKNTLLGCTIPANVSGSASRTFQ